VTFIFGRPYTLLFSCQGRVSISWLFDWWWVLT